MEIWPWGNIAWNTIITLSVLSTSVFTLEETEPEIFLSPRHFNPHPYEATYYRNNDDTNRLGPVLFPPSPPEENDRSKFIAIPRNQRLLNHPVDNHPYSKVAQKRKYYPIPGRFRQSNNHINPRVYEALSNHAAKVLSEPASQLRKDYTLSSLSNEKKNYAFSYKVLDHLSGDDFSHSQSQSSGGTNGEYRVKLPDGRVQIVSYTADKNGYKADVKYTANDLPSTQIERGGSRQIANYQYDAAQYHQDPNTPLSTPDYQSYQGYVTKNPVHVEPKVEIYTHQLANFVGSTVAPYLFQDGGGVTPTPVYTVY